MLCYPDMSGSRTAELTRGEYRALHEILRSGGSVTVTMGRLSGGYVNKMVVRRLVRRGLVEWGSREDYREQGHTGQIMVLAFATAAGCKAVHGYETTNEDKDEDGLGSTGRSA